MWRRAGLFRDARGLEEAVATLERAYASSASFSAEPPDGDVASPST